MLICRNVKGNHVKKMLGTPGLEESIETTKIC